MSQQQHSTCEVEKQQAMTPTKAPVAEHVPLDGKPGSVNARSMCYLPREEFGGS